MKIPFRKTKWDFLIWSAQAAGAQGIFILTLGASGFSEAKSD